MQDYYVVQLIKTIDSDVGLSDMAETVAAKNHFCSCGVCGVGISLCVAYIVGRLESVAVYEIGYVLCFGFAGASVTEGFGDERTYAGEVYEVLKTVAAAVAHHEQAAADGQSGNSLADSGIETAGKHGHHRALIGIEQTEKLLVAGKLRSQTGNDVFEVHAHHSQQLFARHRSMCDSGIFEGLVPDLAVGVDGIPEGAVHVEYKTVGVDTLLSHLSEVWVRNGPGILWGEGPAGVKNAGGSSGGGAFGGNVAGDNRAGAYKAVVADIHFADNAA